VISWFQSFAFQAKRVTLYRYAEATFDKMMGELSAEQLGLFQGLDFKTHDKVAIKNMGEIDTVGLYSVQVECSSTIA
jgi:hypothetical protein